MRSTPSVVSRRAHTTMAPQYKDLNAFSATVSLGCPTLHMELNRLDFHSARLYINRVSNSIPGAPLLNYALTISELPLFSLTHLSSSALCAVLSLHRQPAKPDSQAAYQAFCQPGCLIVLSKHPPAFCLPPPPQKPPRAAILCPHSLPVVSLLSVRPHGFRFPRPIYGFLFVFFLTSLFSHWAKRFMEIFLSKRQMALENVSHPVAYCKKKKWLHPSWTVSFTRISLHFQNTPVQAERRVEVS